MVMEYYEYGDAEQFFKTNVEKFQPDANKMMLDFLNQCTQVIGEIYNKGELVVTDLKLPNFLVAATDTGFRYVPADFGAVRKKEDFARRLNSNKGTQIGGDRYHYEYSQAVNYGAHVCCYIFPELMQFFLVYIF